MTSRSRSYPADPLTFLAATPMCPACAPSGGGPSKTSTPRSAGCSTCTCPARAAWPQRSIVDLMASTAWSSRSAAPAGQRLARPAAAPRRRVHRGEHATFMLGEMVVPPHHCRRCRLARDQHRALSPKLAPPLPSKTVGRGSAHASSSGTTPRIPARAGTTASGYHGCERPARLGGDGTRRPPTRGSPVRATGRGRSPTMSGAAAGR